MKRVNLSLERLEDRVVPTGICGANPAYGVECDYLNALIAPSTMTDTAVKSGDWSDPATWSNGTPGRGATVYIPQGVTVTVDGVESAPLRAVLNQGVLTFATNVDTELCVNTLVSGTDLNGTPSGELDIGTQAAPIAPGVTARLVFADANSVVPGDTQAMLFPGDVVTDDEPFDGGLSGGLISMNTTNIAGSVVTPYVNLANGAMAGQSVLTLASTPIGWKVGDKLLIPGTDPSRAHDEQVTIAAINGGIVDLTAPLQYSHSVAGQQVQVADESRNVVIEDEGTPTQYADGSDGQVMIMHTSDAYIAYASFLGPGGTDKSVPEGSVGGNGLINQRSLYSLHFHECYWPSINGGDPPIQVVGCFQANGVGWGYVNHRSNVDFVDDVAYNDNGACFVDQAGDELGAFTDCLAIETSKDGAISGSPNVDEISRVKIGDFGFMGQGFWLASPATALVGNHVWDAYLSYDYYTLTLAGQGLPGSYPFWNGQQVQHVPLAAFADNTAGETAYGMLFGWDNPGVGVYNTLTDFTAFGVSKDGFLEDVQGYVGSLDFENPVLLAAPGAATGFLWNESYTQNVTIHNADVEGFALGARLIAYYTTQIEGGTWNDSTAFLIPENLGPREVLFTGPLSFGSKTLHDFVWQRPDYLPINNPAYVNEPFMADEVLLPDGSRLFAPWQQPNFVPFPVGTKNAPAAFVGLTESQLWSEYGIALGGAVAGEAPVFSPEQWALAGPFSAAVGTEYTPRLEWIDLNKSDAGQAAVLPSQTVLAGWNVVTAVINGQKYSWLFMGN